MLLYFCCWSIKLWLEEGHSKSKVTLSTALKVAYWWVKIKAKNILGAW
ncbi:hypothetical protein IC582_023743 [Cucumis melo]